MKMNFNLEGNNSQENTERGPGLRSLKSLNETHSGKKIRSNRDTEEQLNKVRESLDDSLKIEPGSLKRIEKRIQDTDKLEIFIEKVKKEERKQANSEKKRNKSALRKFINTTALITTLGASIFSIKKGADIYKEHTEREETRIEIIERTGIDLVEIGEKAGFKVTLETENRDGRYVLHIGQVHHVDETDEDSNMVERIIDNQKGIERVINTLTSKDDGTTGVFSEGMTTESPIQKILDNEIRQVSGIKPSQGAFIKVLKIYQKDISVVNRQIDGKIQSAINHVFHNKINELYYFYKANPHAYEPLSIGGTYFTSFEDEFNYARNSITCSFDSFGNDSIYVAGTTLKLAAENRIKLLASETEKTSDAAINIYKEAKTLEKLGKLDEARQLLVHADKIILEDRENVALNLINNNSNQNIIPLVYGNAHNFKNNVEKHNLINSNEKIGLIRFEVIKD